MYLFYLDGLCLPITPSKISTKIKGNNRTYELANSGEVNLIKFPGLTTYTFDFELLHNLEHIHYKAADTSPIEVLNFLEQAKIKKKVINFTVVRKMRNETRFPISQKVTVEDYTCEEDADNNSDFTVSIELKQFRSYKTKHLANKQAQRPVEKTETKKANKPTTKKASSRSSLKKVKIKTTLNIRSGPGTYSKRVSKFRTGEMPVVYGEMKDKSGKVWYKVKHSAGKDGWAYISSNPRYVDNVSNLKKKGK